MTADVIFTCNKGVSENSKMKSINLYPPDKSNSKFTDRDRTRGRKSKYLLSKNAGNNTTNEVEKTTQALIV
jgi:hypothetical protein